MIELLNCDCMQYMAGLPDKAFNIAITDPPYRDKNDPTKEMRNKINGKMKNFGLSPDKNFFNELFRISNNQIIWGCNNFIPFLKSTNCMLFWYKRNPMPNYSDGEFAWTSFDSISRCIPIDHFGANTSDKIKIHPTQKPVALYKWLLKHYARPGDRIFDSHLGSGSIAIACHDMGYDLVGCELDKDYYTAACERLDKHREQIRMF